MCAKESSLIFVFNLSYYIYQSWTSRTSSYSSSSNSASSRAPSSRYSSYYLSTADISISSSIWDGILLLGAWFNGEPKPVGEKWESSFGDAIFSKALAIY